MAKFTPGPVVASVSGSIGGTVYSRNRGGQYMRFRAVPVTNTSTFALAAKARLSVESQQWQALTDAQRFSWEQAALLRPVTDTLGFARNLTGQQYFVGLNSRRAQAGDARLTAPPVSPAPNGLLTLVLDADIGAGDTDLTFTTTPLGATEKLWIRAAVSNSPGVNYVQNQLRFVGLSAAAQTSPFDIESAVIARLGTLIVGQKLHTQVRVYDTATGLVSRPLRSDAVVSTT